ncbi:Fc.00g011490.m01.CDS01 [Cosmosporella sp. VM-42]
MELTLDDILFSISDDATVAVPFDDPDLDTSVCIGAAAAGNESTRDNREHFVPLQKSACGGYEIDGNDVDITYAEPGLNSEATGLTCQDKPQHLDLTIPNRSPNEWEYRGWDEYSINTMQITNTDDFLTSKGAYRPLVPCTHCARFRLECKILQTTSANPNPTHACSSCVGLFRECSLSGGQKRNASAFETPQPVIGHLHGVSEDGATMIPNGGTNSQLTSRKMPAPNLAARRSNTRSVRKTLALKKWFTCHYDNPYPSEDEKVVLAQQSGLSKMQVVNWFANARRRKRMEDEARRVNEAAIFLRGSPMPRFTLAGMSPMERWKNSPPDEEPASTSAIENAVNAGTISEGSSENFRLTAVDGRASSNSDDSFLYSNSVFQDESSNSASSHYSHSSANSANIISLSARSSAHERKRASWLKRTSPKCHNFQCTFCSQSFKKKYDWVRHERSVHLPGLDSWVCSVPLPPDQPHMVWRVNQVNPECIFCGKILPTQDHFQSHEFETCAERPVPERTFARKDHLWQHLRKFHGCQKWPGWSPNLNLLQHRQDKVRSQCGFCQTKMESWEDRSKHLTEHFREGLTMAEWIGGPGIEELVDQGV